jgi:hypothetical protein
MVRFPWLDFQIKIGVKRASSQKADQHLPMWIQTKRHNAGSHLIRTAIAQALQRKTLFHFCLIVLPFLEQSEPGNRQEDNKSEY